ncbi:MAG: pyridoxamine 5'-phosphate oxidase family protein [Sphaerospermopsis sp. SIO1G2]|nr:pyridoxamine 5'-phosphate oxidase family protein [Sphaerospermopsis sp. SIO1G2]
MSNPFPKTPLNQVKRIPKRGQYDAETIYPIVDGSLICHVGFVDHGRAIVIPTIHAREGDNILLHGSSKSRMMQLMAAGAEVCITVTHLDGLVLARAVFHHSMNYRSAVLYGKGEIINDEAEKMKALEIFTEKLIPGRWDDARQPTPIENKATTIVRVPIDLASAKVRTGAPGDDEPDYDLDIWAGVLPMRTVFGELEADPALKDGIPVPTYLTDYANSKR